MEQEPCQRNRPCPFGEEKTKPLILYPLTGHDLADPACRPLPSPMARVALGTQPPEGATQPLRLLRSPPLATQGLLLPYGEGEGWTRLLKSPLPSLSKGWGSKATLALARETKGAKGCDSQSGEAGSAKIRTDHKGCCFSLREQGEGEQNLNRGAAFATSGPASQTQSLLRQGVARPDREG